ncbi:MAG: RrF2 family transcriptional regulator [Promethearchaeota archaeon]|jgi:Rrf2 family protein
MKIFSKKVKYGLAALFELAKNNDLGYIQIKEIASKQNIPQNYLEQLLSLLKKGGLVKSMRGSQGGYKLNKRANQIKIIDVIEVLDGPLTISDSSQPSEVLRIYWGEIEAQFKNIFDESLEKLVNEEVKLNKRLSFQI